MLMKLSFYAMLTFMPNCVSIFFARRMLTLQENIDVAAIESLSLASVEGHRYALVRFANIIELGTRNVLLDDVRKAGCCATAQKEH